MTRWWTYAVLAIAVIAGTVRAQASPQTRACSELHESVNARTSTARKRHAAPAQVARRGPSGATPHVVVPDRLELAPPTRAWAYVSFVVGNVQTAARAVIPCSRAPPSG